MSPILVLATRDRMLQRQPNDKAQGTGGLALPWKHGDSSLFEETSAGIRVMTCFIAPTTTRFALWEGKPVLMLDPTEARRQTAAHEMGHAIFYYLEKRAESKEADAARAGNFRLKIADIYARLANTKEATVGEDVIAAGLWIADPSQWSPGSAKEHPWQDADEFFASAKAAFQINRKGFEKTIARFKKIDPAVGPPAKELIALLDAFFTKGDLPSKGLPEARATAARKELERISGVSKVEDTAGTSPLLYWLIHPEKRPGGQRAAPSP